MVKPHEVIGLLRAICYGLSRYSKPVVTDSVHDSWVHYHLGIDRWFDEEPPPDPRTVNLDGFSVKDSTTDKTITLTQAWEQHKEAYR